MRQSQKVNPAIVPGTQISGNGCHCYPYHSSGTIQWHKKPFCGVITSQEILMHLGTDSSIHIDDYIGAKQAQPTPGLIQSRRDSVFVQ